MEKEVIIEELSEATLPCEEYEAVTDEDPGVKAFGESMKKIKNEVDRILGEFGQNVMRAMCGNAYSPFPAKGQTKPIITGKPHHRKRQR